MQHANDSCSRQLFGRDERSPSFKKSLEIVSQRFLLFEKIAYPQHLAVPGSDQSEFEPNGGGMSGKLGAFPFTIHSNHALKDRVHGQLLSQKPSRLPAILGAGRTLLTVKDLPDGFRRDDLNPGLEP